LEVHFTDETEVNVEHAGDINEDPNNPDVVATAVDGSLTATIQAHNLKYAGDYVECTYTIENSEDSLSASVALPTIEYSNQTHFEVTTNWDSPAVIAAGDTATVTVRVALLKVPVQEENDHTNVTLTFVASPVEP
jgi:hypothetical protein